MENVMALKASWWRRTQNPRLLFLLSGIKPGSTFISIFSLRIRLNKSNEGIANFWILLKTSLEVQYSGGLYGRETRAAKKEFVILHPQAWKITLDQRHCWMSCTVGSYLGRTAVPDSMESLAHTFTVLLESATLHQTGIVQNCGWKWCWEIP